MTLLIDLGDLADECCNDALEHLLKAVSYGRPGDQSDPVPSRFAAAYIERVSSRLMAIIAQMEEALARFLGLGPTTLRKADEPWTRMDGAKFESTRAYLESKNPANMTLDDYRLLVSWLLARYLPDDVVLSEAEYIAVVGGFMGKIQASLEIDRRVDDPMIATLAALVPTSFAAIPLHAMTPTELAIMAYAKDHAAENIRGIAEQTRHRMVTVILEHQQAALFGQKEGAWRYLATRLFDAFSHINADMRRIAVTEGGEAVNQGYIAAKSPGQKVKRIEAYNNACPFCRSINGLILEVVLPDAPAKDGWKQVWPGKSNFGRSASPRRREGNRLVERSADEQWWPASGVMHPSCRGSWAPVTDRPPDVSEAFFSMLSGVLAKV